jgi:2-C-methyl-D-erythritol 2,4-cyclodiphosphate synthase
MFRQTTDLRYGNAGQAIMNNLRVGLGYDSHRIEPGGIMTLGGVQIDCGSHLVGHSDADALLHAITDAVLSAVGLEDIGQLFPNTDAANKDRDSSEMLRIAMDSVRSLGYSVINVDCIVHSEIPKIAPNKTAMKTRIAELLGVTDDCVGLKGKTGEQVGEVGKGVLLQVHCVALLAK